MMHLTSVLLPAPFSPSRARKQPGSSLSDTPESAWSEPNRFERPSASIGCGSAVTWEEPLLLGGSTTAAGAEGVVSVELMARPPLKPARGRQRQTRPLAL